MSSKPSTPAARARYTPEFLAGSLGLTIRKAKQILRIADGDRTKAAELARIEKS